MSHHDWQDVAIALIAAFPAILAAVSSIRNGRKIDDHDEFVRKNGGRAKRVKKPPSKNGAHPDWYSPPPL